MTYHRSCNFLTVFLLFLLIGCYSPSWAQSKKQRKQAEAAQMASVQNIQRHIEILAADSLEGRRTGTAGEEKAVQYIIHQYQQLAIPAVEASYRQPFEVDEGLYPSAQAIFQINDQTLRFPEDILPMPWSKPELVDAESWPNLQETNSPWWYDIRGDIEANQSNPHFAVETILREKAKEFAKKGASAVVFYNSNPAHEALRYNPKDRTITEAIPVYFLTNQAYQQLNIKEAHSVRLHLQADLHSRIRKGTNVAAYLDQGKPLTIILGAHFDHLGYGEDHNSRYTGNAAIHNGADDNASGTAVLLELARKFKQSQNLPANILFLHFSGEELGLYGSKYYAEHPLIPLEKVSYMINMDMVGRLNNEQVLTIGGLGTSPQWSNLVPTKYQNFVFKIDSSGTGPSDHTSFYRKDLPVLFFFTGLHTDYHKPSDDAATINYKGAAQIAQLIGSIVSNSPVFQKLSFTKTKEQSMGTGRFKVSIGIMPDYTFSGTGVKVDGVIDDRPAKKAGLQAGDIILQLGDHLVTSVETYMQALNRFEKGSTTKITLKRGNEIKTYDLTF